MVAAIGSMDLTWQSILFDIIFTLSIYMLPIDIYRFFIRKRPLPQNLANKVSYIYGLIVWLLLSIIYYILGSNKGANIAAAAIWCTINSCIISAGSSKPEAPSFSDNKKHLTTEFVSITNSFISKINTLFPKSNQFIIDCEAIAYVYIQFMMHFSIIKNDQFDDAAVALNNIIKNNRKIYFKSVFNRKTTKNRGFNFDSFFHDRIEDYAVITVKEDIHLGQSVYTIMNDQQINELNKSSLLRSNLLFMDYIFYYSFFKNIPRLNNLESLFVVDFIKVIDYRIINIKLAEEISNLMNTISNVVSDNLEIDLPVL